MFLYIKLGNVEAQVTTHVHMFIQRKRFCKKSIGSYSIGIAPYLQYATQFICKVAYGEVILKF